jgi:hypothetical protein
MTMANRDAEKLAEAERFARRLRPHAPQLNKLILIDETTGYSMTLQQAHTETQFAG